GLLLLEVDRVGAEVRRSAQRAALRAATRLEEGARTVGELLAAIRGGLEDEELLLGRPQRVEAANGLELGGQDLLGGGAASGGLEVTVLREHLELGEIEDDLVEGGTQLEPIRRL